MSEDEDDTPPESFFFMKRAEFVPKVSSEEFKSVSKLLDETIEEKAKFSEKKEKVPPNKRGKEKNGLKPVKQIVVAEEEILLDDNKDPVSPSPDMSTVVNLAPSVKRRLRRLQTERAKELKSVEEANREILSAADSCSYNEVEEIIVDSSENFANCILTVSYMSAVSRLRCFEHEKFSTIIPRVADLFKTKASELLLCLKDQNIKVDDTPKSLNIKLNDIIECIPYKGSENAEADAVDKMKIFFQSDDRRERVDLFVHKLEKMKEIMQRYSERQEIALDNLRFEFDGEKIEGTETPEDLDMESGNCIDVKILTKVTSPRKRRGRPKKKQSPNKNKCTPLVSMSIEDDVVNVSSNDSDIILCG